MPNNKMPEEPRPQDEIQDDAARPVAVGVPSGDVPVDVTFEMADRDPGAPAETLPADPTFIERPRDEMFTGIIAALLAASTFLPWYKAAFPPRTISGFASGTWGPIVFFLALAAVAIVVLRRLRVPVSFPIETSLMLEGFGWLSVAGALLKKFFVLHQPGFGTGTGPALTVEKGLYAGVVLGAALAIVGARTASSAPMMLRPGWFASTAGKLGASVLAVALVLGLGLGFTASPFASSADVGASPNVPRPKQFKGFPPCATTAKFPQVPGVKASTGYSIEIEGRVTCGMQFTTTLSPRTALTRYEHALGKAKWTFTKLPGTSPTISALTLTGPQCGTVSFNKPADPKRKNNDGQALLLPCPKPAKK